MKEKDLLWKYYLYVSWMTILYETIWTLVQRLSLEIKREISNVNRVHKSVSLNNYKYIDVIDFQITWIKNLTKPEEWQTNAHSWPFEYASLSTWYSTRRKGKCEGTEHLHGTIDYADIFEIYTKSMHHSSRIHILPNAHKMFTKMYYMLDHKKVSITIKRIKLQEQSVTLYQAIGHIISHRFCPLYCYFTTIYSFEHLKFLLIAVGIY